MHSSIFKGDLPTLKEVSKPHCLHLPSLSFQPALYYELKRGLEGFFIKKNKVFRKSTCFQIIFLPVFAATFLDVTMLACCQLWWWNLLGWLASSHPHWCLPSLPHHWPPPPSGCHCCLAKQCPEMFWVKNNLWRSRGGSGVIFNLDHTRHPG